MSDYVLNISNLIEPYPDELSAQAQLSALLTAIASLEDDEGPLPNIRTNQDPWLLPLVALDSGRHLTFGEVVHSFYGTDKHDLASFFDSLSRTVPSDGGLDDDLVEAILRLSPKTPAPSYEQTFDAIQACEVEAGICSVCDFTLISLMRDDRWSHDLMGFTVGSTSYVFDHIATPEHAVALRNRQLVGIRSAIRPRSFWSFKDKAYPNLLFGRDVEAQVDKVNTMVFPLVLSRLSELDRRAAAWQHCGSSPFPPGGTHITGETSQTMKRYGTARNFRGFDGVKRTFEQHLWVDKGNRIHLYFDEGQHTVEVGYIGRHLPTMGFPT